MFGMATAVSRRRRSWLYGVSHWTAHRSTDEYSSSMTLSRYRSLRVVDHPASVATALLVYMFVLFGCAVTGQERASPVRGREVLADFSQRVDRYMQLHEKLQMDGTRPTQMAAIGENQASTLALAERIRSARRHAQQGELFSPAIATTLRTAMNQQLRGNSAAGTRASIRDDGPETFALRVNATYPKGASLATMPPNVLEVLPRLPDGLEYRIVNTHLILWDVDADIVVDYLFDVMCSGC